MDVLIHVADGLLYGDLDYADRIEQRLSAAGLEVGRRDLVAMDPGMPEPSLAHVFTGGETSVNSGSPWMRAAVGTMRQLVAGAEHAGCAVVGICLGSQIMAEALRAGSIVDAATIEMGLAVVERPDDALVTRVVPAFHYQAISHEVATVDGVRVEWGNAHTRVQGFSFGSRAFGCQFHPELTASDLHSIIDRHHDLIAGLGTDPRAAHRSVDQLSEALSPTLFEDLVVDRILSARRVDRVAGDSQTDPPLVGV
jgi:GMP synthase-like glutamine amidotransferase